MSFSYLKTGIQKEHNPLERNSRIQFYLIFLSSLSVFYTDIMNLEKNRDSHESCPLNFSPIYILDPKLFVLILTFRVLQYQSSTKFASFPFDRYRTEISHINYLQKIHLCQNLGDFCEVVENTSSNCPITHQIQKATL